MSKFLTVVVLCILGATLSKAEVNKGEAIKNFIGMAGACVAEVGAAPSDVADIMKKKAASTMQGKCLRACFMKKINVMDANGKFVKAAALEKAQKWTNNDADLMKLAIEVADFCGAIAVSDNHCEAAEAYGKCLREQATARGVEKFI